MDEMKMVCGANPLNSTVRCPVCNGPGKAVRPETVMNIVKEDRIPETLEGYALCLTKDCDVVYFGQKIFGKNDVRVKIWFKETDYPVTICYCSGITDEDIIEHIAVRKCCDDIKDIQRHTGANMGKECLPKNPAGT